MIQGLRTLIYRINSKDLETATAWYSKILGKAPYFKEAFYVGFNVGGFEFGLDPTEDKLVAGNTTSTYWGVANIDQTLAHCLTQGATIDSNVKDVGEGIKVATVRDPFGNILGLIENPHFKIESIL